MKSVRWVKTLYRMKYNPPTIPIILKNSQKFRRCSATPHICEIQRSWRRPPFQGLSRLLRRTLAKHPSQPFLLTFFRLSTLSFLSFRIFYYFLIRFALCHNPENHNPEKVHRQFIVMRRIHSYHFQELVGEILSKFLLKLASEI